MMSDSFNAVMSDRNVSEREVALSSNAWTSGSVVLTLRFGDCSVASGSDKTRKIALSIAHLLAGDGAIQEQSKSGEQRGSFGGKLGERPWLCDFENLLSTRINGASCEVRLRFTSPQKHSICWSC
jgi:hypothetical protein